MSLVAAMNDANASHEKIKEILAKQDILYAQAIDQVMINRSEYINQVNNYESEIFALKKVISINRRANNKYAVLRDEVALKSYLILRSQQKMMKNLLLSLDVPTIDDYEKKLTHYTKEHLQFVNKLVQKDDYHDVLALNTQSRIIKMAQKNIREFYLLKDVNNDMVGYLFKYESKMYRLNKYAKYHLISLAVKINSFQFVQMINPVLEEYGLDVMKLFFIFTLILLIYFFRKIVYVWLERYFLKIDFLKAYSEDILFTLRKPIEILVIIININMVIYVYNDFSSDEATSKIFNIIYGFFFTLFIYKIINTVAAVKLANVKNDDNVQNDLINVGIKIVNFVIIMIGVLIVLYFAGVNLTAVLSGLGIGGFAVAFAAKDTISNFFGTLSILFSDVFSQGDWIEIDGHQGVVVEIGLRVTTIRTFDNALIAIPNGTFASKDVKNWNKRVLGRRIKMYIGVKYDSKSEDIQNAVNEIRQMLREHPEIATKETEYTHKRRRRNHIAKLVSKDDLEGVKKNLFVHLDAFSDSSINILIYCFTKSTQWSEWLAVKEDVMHKIMRILEKNSLEFAFPSLSLYHENQLEIRE